jgi:hypothetical protein
LSRFPGNVINRLEQLGPDTLRMIDEALASPEGDPRRRIVINFALDLDVGRFEEV